MAQVNNEEQVSIAIDNDEIPDTASVTDECDSTCNPFGFLSNNGMIKIEEGSTWHNAIKNCFLDGMGPLAIDTRIVAIHKNSNSSFTGIARLNAFKIFSDAVANKCGGNANIIKAWYGASKSEINEVVCHGFSPRGKDGTHGVGVHLSHLKISLDSVLSTEMDENGLRHVLLCRVILGKMEEVPAGSKQIHPSSREFDSGVNNLSQPTRYIVWSCYMNSYIYVDYVVSFKIPFSEGIKRRQDDVIVPSSPWIRAQNLMAILSRFLHPSKLPLMDKHLNDYRNQKITCLELCHNWKQVAGVRLLIAVSKLYRQEGQHSFMFDAEETLGPSRQGVYFWWRRLS